MVLGSGAQQGVGEVEEGRLALGGLQRFGVGVGRLALDDGAQGAGRLPGVGAGLVAGGPGAGQAEQGAAVGEGEDGGAAVLVGPDVGEGFQHADGGLEQGAVAAQPPLGLQGADPRQGEAERLVGAEAGGGAGDGVLPVGAAQQVEGLVAVAAAAPVLGGGVQGGGEDVAVAGAAAGCRRRWRVRRPRGRR